MDAITLLVDEHRSLERLFEEYETTSERAVRTRQTLADRITAELLVHVELEEQLFYPTVIALVPSLTGDILEDYEEQHIVRWTLAELRHLTAEHPRFHPKASVLIDHVRLHQATEEQDLFPAVRESIDPDTLHELGTRIQELRPHIPTRPHPLPEAATPGGFLNVAGARVVERAQQTVVELVSAARQATRR
jgi:hemerythrin-like domain-containing protein